MRTMFRQGERRREIVGKHLPKEMNAFTLDIGKRKDADLLQKTGWRVEKRIKESAHLRNDLTDAKEAMLDVTVGGGSKGPVSDEAMERKMKLAAKQRAATEKAPVTTSFLTEGQVRLQKLERHLNMKTERFAELKKVFKDHAELPVSESKKVSAFADGFTAELDAIDRDHDMLDFQGLEDCLKELRDSKYANELERSRTGVTASDFLRIGGKLRVCAENLQCAAPDKLQKQTMCITPFLRIYSAIDNGEKPPEVQRARTVQKDVQLNRGLAKDDGMKLYGSRKSTIPSPQEIAEAEERARLEELGMVEEEETDDPFSAKKKTLAAGGFVPLELLQEFPTEAPLSPARVGKLADYGGLGQANDLAYKMHLFAMHEEHVEGLFDRPVDPGMRRRSVTVDGGDAPLDSLETHPSESHSHKPEARRTAVAEIDEKAQVGVAAGHKSSPHTPPMTQGRQPLSPSDYADDLKKSSKKRMSLP